VFDIDRDGVLSQKELQHMVGALLFVCHENKSQEELASDPYGQAGE
jgi:Ca2+-binding EF-hand superfamily protein